MTCLCLTFSSSTCQKQKMQFTPGKFPLLVIFVEIVFIVAFGFFVKYDDEVDAATRTRQNITHKRSHMTRKNSIQDYYPMFQDVDVMIFAGFGFLMTFMKRYGFSAIGLNMLLAAISIQWAIIMQGVWQMKDWKIPMNIVSLLNGNFASATVLISYGALLGKTSPLQLVVMTIIEIAIFACNEHLGGSVFKAVDIGGSIFLHTFGAYFGLAVSYVLYRKDFAKNSKEGSNYHSDIFSMIGTIFLWMFWPSFNSALAVGDEQHRSVINTYAALLACCVVTFAISSLVEGEGKLNMVHVQNATLAGGVAIGATANMMVHPFGCLIVGFIAGSLSTLGYRFLTPVLLKRFHIHDTCGVNNLHGMPGIMAGLLSAIIAAVATETEYGLSLYELYPERSPQLNTTALLQARSRLPHLEAGQGWTADQQAMTQLKALFSTLAIAIIGGAATGYVLKSPVLDPPKGGQLFDDNDYWDVPDEDH